MPLESEIRIFLLIGYIITWAIVGGILFYLWKKTHNKGLLWFLPQFLCTCVSLRIFYMLIDYKGELEGDMLSGFNSLTIAFMAMFWGISMIFMVFGIVQSIKFVELKKQLE